jgi:hypothetical protein
MFQQFAQQAGGGTSKSVRARQVPNQRVRVDAGPNHARLLRAGGRASFNLLENVRRSWRNSWRSGASNCRNIPIVRRTLPLRDGLRFTSSSMSRTMLADRVRPSRRAFSFGAARSCRSMRTVMTAVAGMYYICITPRGLCRALAAAGGLAYVAGAWELLGDLDGLATGTEYSNRSKRSAASLRSSRL